MEEFQNKIKGFTELLQYVFIDFIKRKRTIIFSVSIILLVEIFILFLINSSWLTDYLLEGKGAFLDNILKGGRLSAILSAVVIFFMFSLKFSVITYAREEFGNIKDAFREGFKSSFRILIPIILISGIILEFFFLSEFFQNVLVLIIFTFCLCLTFVSYVSLKEKRNGFRAFIRALHVLRKNFLTVGWKILIFFIVLLLASITILFPFILLYFFIAIPNILGIIIGAIFSFTFLLIFFSLVCLYFSVLSENVWKIRKHIAYYPPPPLYIIAINVFLLVTFLVLIMARIVIG